MNARKILASASLVLTGVTVPAPAGASHSWGGYHWPSDGRGVAVVNQAGGGYYEEALGHTVNKWRKSVAPYATPLFPQGPVAIRYEYGGPPRCDSPGRGEILVCARWLPAGVGGLTSLWVDSRGHIQAARVLFDPRQSPAQIMATLCHEVGHALSLGHAAGGVTCMTSPPNASDPDAHDGYQIAVNHDHLDQ